MKKQRCDSELYDWQGQKMNLHELAREVGLKPVTLWNRLKVQKLTLEEAVSKPVRKYGKERW